MQFTAAWLSSSSLTHSHSRPVGLHLLHVIIPPPARISPLTPECCNLPSCMRALLVQEFRQLQSLPEVSAQGNLE